MPIYSICIFHRPMKMIELSNSGNSLHDKTLDIVISNTIVI